MSWVEAGTSRYRLKTPSVFPDPKPHPETHPSNQADFEGRSPQESRLGVLFAKSQTSKTPHQIKSSMTGTRDLEMLRCARKAKGLTQAQLAELIDTSTVYYSRVERGSVELTYDMAKRLAEQLNLAPLELLPELNKLFNSPIAPFLQESLEEEQQVQLSFRTSISERNNIHDMAKSMGITTQQLLASACRYLMSLK